MEVFLYNSTVCRLCGEENDNGTLLYACEENNQSLCEIINAYLPIKVSDDGELPRTICPGCTIQLEATVEFLNLIINGQKILRELHQREKEYKKTVLNNSNKGIPEIISEKIIYEINTSNGVYQVEHPISLQVSGFDKPKRKRGRPPKKHKTPEELAQETPKAIVQERKLEVKTVKEEDERSGKRRRKTPTRFKEAVQGKELERIFIEEGVIDDNESEHSTKSDTIPEDILPVNKEPQVIGHLEESGELVVVVKGKGRGRPKGRMRQTREECAICGMEFVSTGRYMSHIAQHGPVLYKCDCGETFNTKLLFSEHQNTSGHSGRTVVPRRNGAESSKETEIIDTTVIEIAAGNTNDVSVKGDSLDIPQALPDLSDSDPLKSEDSVKTEAAESEDVTNVTRNESNERVSVADAAETNNEEEKEESKKEKVRLKCNHCDKMFSTRQSKSIHTKAVHMGEKAHACVECGARFAYPRSLAVHRLAHRRARPSAGYACDLCGKVLNHPSSVVYHKQAAHAAQRYVCGACGKQFRHKQLLQRHQLVHTQARPFSCKACNSTFKTRANLLNHQLLHSGVKKYSCDICKHKFAHKTSLTLHTRWHTGLKPFSCGVCGKTFSQKGNLSEHERIHTGEKPYQCTLCPRRFTTSSQHRLHARRHAERAHCCGKCGKRMSSRSVWAAHVRRDDCAPKRLLRQKATKQVSLLVNDKNQRRGPPADAKLSDDDAADERVIYVAYDTEDSDSAFHILDPDQTADLEQNKVITTCELYAGPSLLVPQLQQAQAEAARGRGGRRPGLDGADVELGAQHAELEHEELALSDETIKLENQLATGDMEPAGGGASIPVTDESGNPLHFTMADGTKLAITSVDGKTLQVITQDGQTIPVEINGYESEEVSNSNTVVHQLHLHRGARGPSPASSPVTHYFTIV